jgi:hypothetical protein
MLQIMVKRGILDSFVYKKPLFYEWVKQGLGKKIAL